MVNYLYEHTIWKDTTAVIGVDNAQEALDTTDFDTNYKSQSIEVASLVVFDNTYQIEKTYAQFKALIDGVNILWSDVRYEVGPNHYHLYLMTNTPI